MLDLTGQVFSRLTCLEKVSRPIGILRGTYWKCLCVCGNFTIVYRGSLTSGNTTSCGCYRDDFRTKDLLGLVFTKLKVIAKADNQGGQTSWKVLCDCGNTLQVRSHSLLNGHTKSCGCFKLEKAITHGQSMLKGNTYATWGTMKARCNNPNATSYAKYGGAGIKVCERWMKFENFLEDMGSKPSKMHSIDRFPNQNGDYEPSNCRWATPKEQTLNRSGERQCIPVQLNGVYYECMEDARRGTGLTIHFVKKLNELKK